MRSTASLYAVVAQNVFVAIYYWRDRQKLRYWLASQCVGLAPVGSLAACFRLPNEDGHGQFVAGAAGDRPGTGVLLALRVARISGITHGRLVSVAITIVALIVPAVVLWCRRESRQISVLLALWFVVPVALLVLQSLNQNRFLPRVLLCTTPPLALLLGCAMTQPGKMVARAVLIFTAIALLAANLYALRNYYFLENRWVKSDLRDAAGKLAKEFRAGDIVVHMTESSFRPFQWYLGDGVGQGVINPPVYQPHLFRCDRGWSIATIHQRLPSHLAGLVSGPIPSKPR